ncbi:DUF2007 domain-containing protein [Sphingomonas sp. LaA6.9]|uniref:putative signal transducing protein n=1 Tax=Sphingomonas sp. LaA6.9 TaxID=2919914 RepID=UPI001F4FC379|nr:DUF2007 domain-containing protein [Sphingomonas sp. LaA6.9]MCJ8156294.1 DUF2007 domain-containing protein [Sphingomonas sp. LaA6.9]
MALITIAEFPDGIAADLALLQLKSAGIPAYLFDGGMASLGLGMMTPARLMVDEDDAERGRLLLQDIA